MITFKQEEHGNRGKFTILENETIAGEMTYAWASQHILIINHTEVNEAFGGKGYGRQLVMKGVEFAREKGVKIMPTCSYAKKVMEDDETLHDMIFR